MFTCHAIARFTVYDFKKMQRRSYYPQNNPQIVSTVTATSSTGVVSRPVTPATMQGDMGPTETNGSVYGHKPSHEMEQVRMDASPIPIGEENEKTYAC